MPPFPLANPLTRTYFAEFSIGFVLNLVLAPFDDPDSVPVPVAGVTAA